MSLTEELEARVALGRKKIPTDVLEIMDKATNNLQKSGLSNKSLKEGAFFPDFKLPNEKGDLKNLEEIKGNKATVISFYRGGWCPYCNIELQALQKSLPDFEKLEANLIAITPETPDNSLSTSEKNEISFSVISDLDNELAKQLGLVFKMDKDLEEVYYHTFNIDLEKHNKNKDAELPMAATYVIDKENKIHYAFITEDYTKRAEISEILEALKAI